MSFDTLFADDERRFQVIRVLNIGVKQIMKENKYLEFGYDRKYYDSNEKNIPVENMNDFILRFL